MGLQGIRVNGTPYRFDYDGLLNKPSIPDVSYLNERIDDLATADNNLNGRITSLETNVSNLESYYNDHPALDSGLPFVGTDDAGKYLRVNENGVWDILDGSTGDELPTVSATDSGKLLGVDSNGNWAAVPDRIPKFYPSNAGNILYFDASGRISSRRVVETEIPPPSVSDAGRYLRVNSAGKWSLADWPFPVPTSADSGLVLSVNQNGEWELLENIAILPDTVTTELHDIAASLKRKVDKEAGKRLSENDYTTAEKNKLAGIEEGATRVLVDNALSASSSNPIMNSIITQILQNYNDRIQALEARILELSSLAATSYTMRLTGLTLNENGIASASSEFGSVDQDGILVFQSDAASLIV